MKNKEIKGVLQLTGTNTEEDFYIPLSSIKYIKTTSDEVFVYIVGIDAPVIVERSKYNIDVMFEWITFSGGIV